MIPWIVALLLCVYMSWDFYKKRQWWFFGLVATAAVAMFLLTALAESIR